VAIAYRVKERLREFCPAHFEAINPCGTLTFDVAGVLKRSRRSLRQPGEDRS
jgi:hypothetical protein